MDQVNIEGLSSLKSLDLCLSSINGHSFGNQNSLKNLTLSVRSEINYESIIILHEIFPNIERLSLDGNCSNIEFYSFVNLKKLTLCGLLLKDFNFEIFKNICNQLIYLCIVFDNINNENISNLLSKNNFPNVLNLEIGGSLKLTRLEKKLFDGFPMLQSLSVYNNKKLKRIDKDAFSNLNNLKE